MINFKISYHNTNLEIIKKKLNYNKKTFNDINKILSNLTSLTITNNTTDLNIIKNITKIFIENKDTFIVFGTGGSNLGAKALINILQGTLRDIQFFGSHTRYRVQLPGGQSLTLSSQHRKTRSPQYSIGDTVRVLFAVSDVFTTRQND